MTLGQVSLPTYFGCPCHYYYTNAAYSIHFNATIMRRTSGEEMLFSISGRGVVKFCLCVANRYSLKAQNTHNDLSAPTECRTACPIASFSDIIKSSTVLYTSHLNCLLYHTNFSQLSGLPTLPLIPWTLTSHISLHGRYRTLIDFQCKHWNGPAAFTEKNIDLLFFCLKM